MLRRTDFIILAAIAGIGYGATPFLRGLWNPDEPRVAHIAASMARGEGLVVPRINGEPFLQEPPLAHWLIALTFRVAGAGPGDDRAPRIPSVLAALGTVLLAGIAAGRRDGPAAGFFSALVLATMAEFLEVSNRAGTDALATLFTAVGGMQLVAISGEERLSARRSVVLGFAAGLAFLSKNLLGPMFLASIAAVLAIRRRDLLRLPSTWLAAAAGLAAAIAVAAPWLVLLAREDPEHLRLVLLHHTFGRALALEGIHDPPFLEFLGRIFLDTLPWLPLLLPALVGLAREAAPWRLSAWSPAAGPGQARALALLAWIVPPALAILLAGSKRDLYLLPAYPALALVLGRFLPGLFERPGARRPAAVLVWLLALPLPAMALLGGVFAGTVPEVVFAGLFCHLLVLHRWVRGKEWRSGPRSCMVGALLLGLAVVSGNALRYRSEDRERSYAALAAALRELRGRGFTVYGHRLGMKGESAVGYYLGERFEELPDRERVKTVLAPDAPPSAVVVERSLADEEGDALFPETVAAMPFPVKKDHLVLFVNRTSESGRSRP